jgi:hypothetical protein
VFVVRLSAFAGVVYSPPSWRKNYAGASVPELWPEAADNRAIKFFEKTDLLLDFCPIASYYIYIVSNGAGRDQNPETGDRDMATYEIKPQNIADALHDKYVGIAMDEAGYWCAWDHEPIADTDFRGEFLPAAENDHDGCCLLLTHLNIARYEGEWYDSWTPRSMTKQTATELYTERHENIVRVLDWIGLELDAHRGKAQADPKDFGYASDLGHVREKLIQTLTFLSNRKPKDIKSLLGECC